LAFSPIIPEQLPLPCVVMSRQLPVTSWGTGVIGD
jgi:hypothetical protein